MNERSRYERAVLEEARNLSGISYHLRKIMMLALMEAARAMVLEAFHATEEETAYLDESIVNLLSPSQKVRR